MKRQILESLRSATQLVTIFYLGILGWSGLAGAECWEKSISPIYDHPSNVTSDSTVVWDSDISKFRMVFTADNEPLDRTVIASATSPNGVNWTPVSTSSAIEGAVLEGTSGNWDESLETAFLMQIDNEWLMYYTGYRNNSPSTFGVKAGDIGLAISSDGTNFDRLGAPVLTRSPNGYDHSGAYSPSIILEDKLYMIYTGFCLDSSVQACDKGITILGATSTDGIKWTKQSTPVLTDNPSIPWMNGGVGEASLMKGPDGKHYIFFTGFQDNDTEPGAIGWAVSSNGPFGDYMIQPNPIVEATPGSFDQNDVIAPSMMVVGNDALMWYTGFTETAVSNPDFSWGFRVGFTDCSNFFSE